MPNAILISLDNGRLIRAHESRMTGNAFPMDLERFLAKWIMNPVLKVHVSMGKSLLNKKLPRKMIKRKNKKTF